MSEEPVNIGEFCQKKFTKYTFFVNAVYRFVGYTIKKTEML